MNARVVAFVFAVRRAMTLAVAVAVALAAACSRAREPSPGSASGTGTGSASGPATRDPSPVASSPDAGPDAPPPAADAGAGPDASFADLGLLDPKFLDGVTVIKGGTVDATSLGATVDVRVVERVLGRNTGLPSVEVLLILSGSRTIAVDIGHTWEYLEEDIPDNALILVDEADPPKPWSDEDDPYDQKRLPSRKPMLYAFSAESPHLVDSFVVVREKDALVAYSYFIDEGEHADAWEKEATIRLARGATLRFP